MNVGVGWILFGGLVVCGLGLLLNLLAGRRRTKVTEEQRIEAVKHKRALEALVSTEGWKLLEEAAKVQAVSRRNEVMMKPADNPLVQEFEKGTVQGIEIFMAIPKILLENAHAVLKAYDEQEGE